MWEMTDKDGDVFISLNLTGLDEEASCARFSNFMVFANSMSAMLSGKRVILQVFWGSLRDVPGSRPSNETCFREHEFKEDIMGYQTHVVVEFHALIDVHTGNRMAPKVVH